MLLSTFRRVNIHFTVNYVLYLIEYFTRAYWTTNILLLLLLENVTENQFFTKNNFFYIEIRGNLFHTFSTNVYTVKVNSTLFDYENIFSPVYFDVLPSRIELYPVESYFKNNHNVYSDIYTFFFLKYTHRYYNDSDDERIMPCIWLLSK